LHDRVGGGIEQATADGFGGACDCGDEGWGGGAFAIQRCGWGVLTALHVIARLVEVTERRIAREVGGKDLGGFGVDGCEGGEALFRGGEEGV